MIFNQTNHNAGTVVNSMESGTIAWKLIDDPPMHFTTVILWPVRFGARHPFPNHFLLANILPTDGDPRGMIQSLSTDMPLRWEDFSHYAYVDRPKPSKDDIRRMQTDLSGHPWYG